MEESWAPKCPNPESHIYRIYIYVYINIYIYMHIERESNRATVGRLSEKTVETFL